jgi:RHS repeat-associated protein
VFGTKLQKYRALGISRLQKFTAIRTPISLVTVSDYQVRAARAVTSANNRYYDPTTGEFVSVDPDVGVTGQPYGYAGDDPIDNADPLGLCIFGGSWCNGIQHVVASTYDSFRHQTASVADFPANAVVSAGSSIFNAYDRIYQDGANGCPFFSIATQENVGDALFGDESAALMFGGEGEAEEASEEIATDVGHAGIHQYPGIEAGKSQFYDNVNLGDLSDTNGLQGTVQSNGNVRYVLQAPEDIGVDRSTGLPTSLYTVIRGPAGNVITMFPGTSPLS